MPYKTNQEIDEEFAKEFGHWGEIWNGKCGDVGGMTVQDFIHQIRKEDMESLEECVKENKIGYIGFQYRYGKEALTDILKILSHLKETI
jgi:hypothetical protein